MNCLSFAALPAFAVTLGAQITSPNAASIPSPEIQFLDSTGAPLAGARLCSYAAGTSTPLSTYTDSAARTANPNPAILDSRGRAPVWIGAARYRFVLLTGGDGECSTGIVRWTEDNITDATLHLTNYVINSNTSPARGSMPRTQSDKNSDTLSVKDLGAVGDGTTDDSAAIFQAIADSSLSSCIHFPDGVYATSVALSSTHPVCLTGNTWRLKYTGLPKVAAVLSLIGDPAGNHSTFMEGSSIQGAIFDGQGRSTNGLVIRGVVSGQMNYLRATNVLDAGVVCNWCQQMTFDHLSVSADFETFTTTPVRGLVIDGTSSANIFTQINIDHVSGNGIDMLWALNTLIQGGTSEGNGGIGVNCTGSLSPYRYCMQNSFIQLDTEANAGGDYFFSDLSYFNTIVAANSFSTPGIHFSGTAHANTVVGGSIGPSIADAHTFGNRLVNVSAVIRTGTPWTDQGQNWSDTIYNQSDASFTDPVNNYNVKDSTIRFSPSGRSIRMRTPSDARAAVTVGNDSSWIGFDTQNGFTAGWLTYNASGMNFMSESTVGVGAVPDGSIVNHNWGFGRFNQTPKYPFHFFDAVTTTVAIQAGSGQGGTDLLKFLDPAGARTASVGADGEWAGPLAATTTIQTAAPSHALCQKADNTIGHCSTAVSPLGVCTCK